MQSFDGMKQRAKKAASHDKLQRKQTGGGTFVPEVDDVNNKMLALLGNQAQPLRNPFDADADYNDENGWLVWCFYVNLWLSFWSSLL